MLELALGWTCTAQKGSSLVFKCLEWLWVGLGLSMAQICYIAHCAKSKGVGRRQDAGETGESAGYLGNQLVIQGISWLSGARIFPYGTAGSVTEGRKALRSKKRDKLQRCFVYKHRDMQKYKYMHISNMLHIFPLNSQFPQSTRQSRIFFFWLLTKINLEERAKQIIFTQ